MDDSYPIILNNNGIRKSGSIKELTMLELQRETRRLFKDEFDKSTVKYAVEGQDDIFLESNDDLDTEWEELNGDSDDDNEDDDDDAEDEDKRKKPLRIVLIFTIKKIEIKPPKPISFRIESKSSTTVTFSWKLGHNKSALDQTQISSLKFEIIQQLPQIDNDNGVIVQCNPITNSAEKYVLKLSGLQPQTRYQFVIRSVLYHENQNKYSDSSEPQTFDTSKYVSLKHSQIPRIIAPPTDLQVIALYPHRVILAWNHVTDYEHDNYDYEYYIEETDVFGGDIVAATEDQHFLQLVELTPCTQYTFVCKAKYYDPQRRLSDHYYRDSAIVSAPTNTVTIITPEEKTTIDDYKTRPIDKARWTKQGTELELIWNAPESFHGRIEYELMDKIQSKIMGSVNKLPVTMSTGEANLYLAQNLGNIQFRLLQY